MNLREATQQALEALEALQGGCTDHDDGTVEAITVWCPEVITALRAALAEPVQEAEELKDPAEYDDFAAAIRHNERVTTRRYDSVGPVKLETVYETIIHWDEGGGKRSRRELARRIVDLYAAPLQRTAEPVQKPVAWLSRDDARLALWEAINKREFGNPTDDKLILDHLHQQGLWIGKYTAPPQRKPLVEEKIDGLFIRSGLGAYHQKDFAVQTEYDRCIERFARAIEQAHGIKE